MKPTSLANYNVVSFEQFSTAKTEQDDKYMIQLEKHSDSRIHDLDIQRHKLLASVPFMTSQPDHKHSYNKGTLMKKVGSSTLV